MKIFFIYDKAINAMLLKGYKSTIVVLSLMSCSLLGYSAAKDPTVEGEQPFSRTQQCERHLLTKTVLHYLNGLSDSRKSAILKFHEKYEPLMRQALGSKVKHQAWMGGYLDHLAETFRIAEMLINSLGRIRSVDVSLDSAIIVLYFHDIEKVWKYTTGLPHEFDKTKFLLETLKNDYGIILTETEKNALKYIHGESEAEYNPDTRLMGPLAALCHTADTISARLWFNEGHGLGY